MSLQTILTGIQQRHAKHVKEAEKKARAKLAKAKTETERYKIKRQLETEKLQAKTDLLRARAGAKRAQAEYQSAKRQVSGPSFGERMAGGLSRLQKSVGGVPAQRSTSRRPTKKTSEREDIDRMLWG
jgi:multidrug resistance efflux pump